GAAQARQGSTSAMPKPSKSLVLRVARVRSWAIAVAAIRPSIEDMPRPARFRQPPDPQVHHPGVTHPAAARVVKAVILLPGIFRGRRLQEGPSRPWPVTLRKSAACSPPNDTEL